MLTRGAVTVEQVAIALAHYSYYDVFNGIIHMESLCFRTFPATNAQVRRNLVWKIFTYQEEPRLSIDASFERGQSSQFLKGRTRIKRVVVYYVEETD